MENPSKHSNHSDRSQWGRGDREGRQDSSQGQKVRGERIRGRQAWGQKPQSYRNTECAEDPFRRENRRGGVSRSKRFDPRQESERSQEGYAVQQEHFDCAGELLREDRLEGKNPIAEALTAGREIEKLWYLKDSTDPVLKRLIARVAQTQSVLLPVDRATLDRLSQTRAHQGVIAQVALLPTVDWQDLLARAEEKGEAPFLLIADEIQDSYNLGSLFRIAEAAGVHGIIIPRRRQVGLDAVTAKASAGAIHHVPCARVTNLAQTIESLQERGLWVGGATMEGESVYGNRMLNGPLALVIGNEGKGLSPLVRKRCDFLLSIPMLGTLNSLNAAVAAGIIVFETVRVRGQKNSN